MIPLEMIDPDTPLSELQTPYARWLREGDALRPYSPHTIRAYLQAFSGFYAIIKENMVTHPKDVNAATIRYYIKKRAESGASAATITANLTALENFFAYCQFDGLVDGNPVGDYKRALSQSRRGGRKPKRIPPVLSRVEQAALIDVIFSRSHANRDRDLALVGFLLDSGLRTAEVCALTLQEGRAFLESGRLRVIGKGDRERDVRPLDDHRAHLAAYVECRSAEEGGEPLFPSLRGRHMSQAGVHALVSGYLMRAGIDKPQMGGHLLRHTAASRMVSAGINIRRVQETLGHASLTTTENYVHLLD